MTDFFGPKFSTWSEPREAHKAKCIFWVMMVAMPPATRHPSASSPVPDSPGWRKAFSSFQNPHYRYFYFGQLVSLLGTSARTMAMGWLAVKLTNSAFELGVVYTLNTLPLLLFSVFAGSLADRFSRLSIFKATSWFAMSCSFLLALLILAGKLNITLLMVFAALWGTAMAFEMPSRQALMTDLVEPGDLVNAISLNSAMVNASRVVGPAVGGPLLVLGPAWCFLFDSLSFLAVLYSLYHIKPRKSVRPRADSGWLNHLLEGARYIGGRPLLLQAILLLFFMSVGGWAYQSQLPAFVKLRLGLGEWGLTELMAAAGLGSCIAAFLVAGQGAKIVKSATLFLGIGFYAVFIFAVGFQDSILPAALLIFPAAFGVTLLFSSANSFLQINTPPHLRGRVMGLWALVFGGGMPVGSFLMGLVAAHGGPGVALQAGGAFSLVVSLLVYLVFKRLRD